MRIRSFALLLLASAAALQAHATADDPGLHGCWRGQQAQRTLADGTQYNTNGDCVVEFSDGGLFRSRCHSSAGDSDSQSRYEVIAPGRIRSTVVTAVPATATPSGTVSEVRYTLKGDWLVIERDGVGPAPQAKPVPAGKQVVSFKSLSVRVPAAAGAECRPRGANPLRIGNTPASSLDLGVPKGWQPWLVDPAEDKSFGQALGASFLVGGFVPSGTPAGARPRLRVFVLDDTRSGPEPVSAAGFDAVQRRFLSEMPEPRLACDPVGSACGLVRSADSQIYSELVHVKGRVAIVTAAVSDSRPAALDELRRAARAFAVQLRSDNPH